jgi:acyl-CoA reductase-like NAD-dependent aldehyde dehydrogenase
MTMLQSPAPEGAEAALPAPAGAQASRADDLKDAFARQRRAFDRRGGLSLDQRRAQLKALRALVKAKADAFARAVGDDFRGRSPHETLIAEVGVLLAAIDYALPRLARWAKPERVGVGWRFWPARGMILKQPLGVVGVLSPWNYPVQLALMPVVASLAAGCRALVKPSELTPATSALLAEILAETFPPDVLAAVTGGPEVAAAISRLPFDSLIFTGSGRIGRQVMAAAAETLTPVVLELGGKSPVLVDETADLDAAAASIMAGKLLNAGQTCIAPDYALVPRRLREPFIDACRIAARRLYPDPSGPDYTAIRGEGARERLIRLQQGLDAVPLFDAPLPSPKLAPAILRDPPPDSAVMREEIFGPLLPVVSYDDPEEAVAAVNARPRPLALYWFGRDRARLRPVLERTLSGGVAVNETILQAAVEALPFGGVGASGFGAYHGRAGFDAFTHRRAVLVQSRWGGAKVLRPPYGRLAERLLKLVLR